MGKLNLADLDLMAMFRVAQEIANTDSTVTENEAEVFIKYAAPLNMSEGRMDRFINSAMKMDLQDAFDTLKELEPELKQYASNFFAEVALANGEVSDEENGFYSTVLETCGLPFTTIGQDDSGDTAPQSKYSEQELCAIDNVYFRVWDGADAGEAMMLEFMNRYNVYSENATFDSLSDDEAEAVLYAMSDEKKEEVSKMLLDVIVAKDPADKLMCDAINIEQYYDLVVRAGLPDLLTDHILDYSSEYDDGEQFEGLQFTLKDLYAIWSMEDMKFDLFLDFVFDGFFLKFHVDDDLFITLRDDNYLEQLDFGENALRLSRLGAKEREYVSRLMAETLSFNIGEDDEISHSLDAYKELVDDYDLPDCLGDFLDGHGMSEYRMDKQALVTKVMIKPDVFVDGLSQTKIQVTVNTKGCKDGELRCIASVYYADDDSPVPDPDFMHYGAYGWYYDESVLSVYKSLYPSYDDSLYEDLEMFLPNDFLPTDRDYYIKVCVFDFEEQDYISYPSHAQKYRFKATKNEYDPDMIALEPTYIVVSYYEKDRKKIPGDYRDYCPCTVRFEQLGPLASFDKLKESLGAESLSIQNDTPKLDQISEKLNLKSQGVDEGMKLCIMYDKQGAHGYNKLRDLAGLGCNNDTFYETLVVCLQKNENDGVVYGFQYLNQLREVLSALDEAVYGLAYNGPVYDQPDLAKAFRRRFWEQVEKEISKLNYESIRLSERATVIPPKTEMPTDTGEAKGAYHVILKSPGNRKLVVIKLVQEIMHSDLKKAMDLVNAASETIKVCPNEDEAYALKAKLEAAGAEVEIRYYYYIND